MDPRLQRRVQRYGWDKAVPHYEQYWQAQLEPAQTRLLEMVNLQPGERVIDVACGTGLVTFRAAEQVGAEGAVLGTDISEQMVENSRQTAEKKGMRQITFQRMDAEGLRLDDSVFDAALCALGLMYVPDPVSALSQMKRTLRTGGRAAAAVWGERAHCGWAEIFPIVDSRVESEVCPLFFRLGTQNALEQTFREAGYTDIVSDRLSTTLYYDSEEDACGAAFDGGPVALAYSRFDDQTREETHAKYLASIEPYRTNGGYEIPGEFVITCGRSS